VRARLYESHYLTAVAPDGGRAVWIRYTAHKESHGPARGTLWCTVFSSGEAPLARRRTADGALGMPSSGAWAQIAAATIGPGRAEGELDDCRWSVTWRSQAAELPYLPRVALYDRRVPRSNGVALAPSATFAGHVDAPGGRLDLTDWRGMIGHNWGVDHADRWIWLHVTGLGERDPDGWIDIVLVRVRVGPFLSPWIPAGALSLDGERRRVGAGPTARGLRVEVGEEAVSVALPRLTGGGLELATRSPLASTARWDYASPGGGRRDVRNCSIASALVTVGAPPAFEVNGRFAVEIGV
jgi:hypothetical protein